jgi:hypothetical protein
MIESDVFRMFRRAEEETRIGHRFEKSIDSPMPRVEAR